MKKYVMKTPSGQLMSRIPEKDIPYHLKNGWELETVQDKPESKKKSTVDVDLKLDINEEKQ